MIRTRLGYTLLLYALLPLVLLRLVWRARRQPAYLRHIPERFGFYPQKPTRPLIWLHAVSVGETRAAAPLVQALQDRYPGHQILLTHMTPTGRATGEAIFGTDVLRCYLPYDYPGAVARFLGHFNPQAGVLMETEIWANLIHCCSQRQIPLYLVNARLSERSFARYWRFAELARKSLGKLAAVAAQTGDDAGRLSELGAVNVTVAGNIKFDVTPPAAQLELGRAWRTGYGRARPVLLAASTRVGEEDMLLDALEQIAVPSLLAVIVPRHPQRFDQVAALIARRGIRFQRRSSEAAIVVDTRVLLGDSMGEMFAYYAACDIAFIGGSLLPFGGQNLIEACAAGRPVLVGPHTYNFSEATELAVAAGAALRVRDTADLARAVQHVLEDPAVMKRMAEAALAFSRAHQGATKRTLELIRFG